MTNDGAFRVITASTSQTVSRAIEAQHGLGETARHFADLITGTILVRETMAPSLRVQGIVRGADGTGTLVADSNPTGQTRGLIQLPESEQEIKLGSGAVLQLMRSLPSGRINQGIVEFPSDQSLSQALMAYFQTSEQVISMVAVGTIFSGSEVIRAGGYLVQLLPDAGRGPLMLMTERLAEFESIDEHLRDESFSPEWLLEQLLYGLPYTRLDESDVRFECWCDHLRVVSALATLSRSDIQSLLDDEEALDISCDYCGKGYQVMPSELRGLLNPS
jgi:molecular chaperone Hsp33